MNDQVVKIISQVMDVPVEQLNPDSSFETVENWDSLNHMNLVLALEEAFGVQFTDEEITEILDVSSIVSTIQNKKA